MNYTIIAHKDSGELTCRGHAYETWGSGFDREFTRDRRAVVNTIADYYFRNLTESGEWEVEVLINGVPNEYLDRSNYSEGITQRFYRMAMKIAKAKYAVHVQKKEAEAARKRAIEKQHQIDAARDTLNRLLGTNN